MAISSDVGAGNVDLAASGPEFRASSAYRRYVAWLLCAVYAINMMDRQLLAVLLEPIKLEFELSDLHMGLLGGIAFAMFYSTLGMPIARFADRGNRSWIIALSILVWSAFTTLTGLVRGVGQLLVARIGVAVGEAGCNPAAYSLLADYFPPARRGKALAIYQMGANVGAFLGLFIGGRVAQAHGWRTAFLIIGIPGVLLGLLVKLSLREPPRGFSDAVAQPMLDEPPPALRVLGKLWAKRSFRHLSIAAALHNFAIYGASTFFASFLIRTHGMSVAQAGTTLAVVYLIGGLSGTYFAGALSDHYVKRSLDPRYYLWVPAVLLLIGFPFGQLVYASSSSTLCVVAMFFAVAAGSGYLAPSVAATYRLVDGRERALASALLLLILNLVGLGLGPMFSGWLSDQLNHHFVQQGMPAQRALGQGLRYSLAIMAGVNLWSAAHYFVAARWLRQDAIA